MQLNEKQKTRIADFVTDIGKVSIAALVFGQFLSKEPFNWYIFFTGLIISLLFVGIALILESNLTQREE
ncbi:MAG: hypothetical protein AB1765_13385 [Candidatus Hydrogenedentota bacterium]